LHFDAPAAAGAAAAVALAWVHLVVGALAWRLVEVVFRLVEEVLRRTELVLEVEAAWAFQLGEEEVVVLQSRIGHCRHVLELGLEAVYERSGHLCLWGAVVEGYSRHPKSRHSGVAGGADARTGRRRTYSGGESVADGRVWSLGEGKR
jgi:hypothetical protein